MLVDLPPPFPARGIELKCDGMRNSRKPHKVDIKRTDGSFDRRIKLLCHDIFVLVDDATLQKYVDHCHQK